jgi:hypothetical protein
VRSRALPSLLRGASFVHEAARAAWLSQRHTTSVTYNLRQFDSLICNTSVVGERH